MAGRVGSQSPGNATPSDTDPQGLLLPDLTESDVAEAMRDIPGYLDISPQDFREVYRASAAHALARLAGSPAAGSLMRTGGPALSPAQPLAVAVAQMAGAGVKSAAVVDAQGLVRGILSETDVLRHLGADSSLALLARLAGEPDLVGRCCAGTRVESVMTAPAETLGAAATLPAMTRAFARHPGRTMPVVDPQGRLLGMLARKDLVRACGAGLALQGGFAADP
jgi:CBS-domain-containing membrane protein